MNTVKIEWLAANRVAGLVAVDRTGVQRTEVAVAVAVAVAVVVVVAVVVAVAVAIVVVVAVAVVVAIAVAVAITITVAVVLFAMATGRSSTSIPVSLEMVSGKMSFLPVEALQRRMSDTISLLARTRVTDNG